jgi:hypothetical protein
MISTPKLAACKLILHFHLPQKTFSIKQALAATENQKLLVGLHFCTKNWEFKNCGWRSDQVVFPLTAYPFCVSPLLRSALLSKALSPLFVVDDEK